MREYFMATKVLVEERFVEVEKKFQKIIPDRR